MAKFSNVGLRNYIDKTRARKDAREEAIMSIYAKHGGIGLRKIFGSDYRKPDQTVDALNMDDIDTDDIDMGDIKYSSSKAESQALKLKEYGMSNEALARFAASGDPTVFERLLKIVNNQRKLYEGEGLKMPEEIIAQVVEEATISGPASSGRINIPAIEKYIKGKLDPLYKGILEQQDVTAGSVTLFEPTFVEYADQSKIGELLKNAGKAYKSMADMEKNILTSEINKIRDDNAKRKKDNLPPLPNSDILITAISNRLVEITETQKLGQDGQAIKFAQMYGNSFVKDFVEKNPTYRKEDFPPIFVGAFNIIPLIPNMEIAKKLVQNFILRPDSTIKLAVDYEHTDEQTGRKTFFKAGDPIQLGLRNK